MPERPIGQVSKTLVPFGNASSNLAPSAKQIDKIIAQTIVNSNHMNVDTYTLGVLSGIINAIGIIPYIYAVVKGKARPNRVTWIIFTFAAWTILIASYMSGVKSTGFWLIAAASNSTIILILSFTKGRGVWEKDALDIGCLTLGLLGIVLWQITKNPSVSVYMGCLIDVIAVIPTFRKVYHDPTSEPKIAWTMGFISAILNVFAIDSTRLVIMITPVTVFIWHVAVLLPMYFRKSKSHPITS